MVVKKKKRRSLPPRWSSVYRNDAECRFFIALARDPKYKWRSTAALARESGSTAEEVERIIAHYFQKHPNMIMQNPKNADQWGYWERNRDLLPEKKSTIGGSDQKSRVAGSKKQRP